MNPVHQPVRGYLGLFSQFQLGAVVFRVPAVEAAMKVQHHQHVIGAGAFVGIEGQKVPPVGSAKIESSS